MPALPNLLRWPLWIAELFTGAKSFLDNPLIGSHRLNRMGLHHFRVRAAAAMTAQRRWRLASRVSPEDRTAFARSGYVEWRDVLPAEDFTRMRDALMHRAWPARETVQGDTITRRIAVDAAMLRAVPELKTLLRSPRWRGLMHYVAGFRSEPLYYIQSILPHRVEGGEDPQNTIHADAFHPSMKAWLFLTDVAPEDGPLSYVAGSHRLTGARLDWEQNIAMAAPDGVDRLTGRGSPRIAETALADLGLPAPTPFAVPANTLIVCDTFGFHARARASQPSVRVELWAYARRNPFLPWLGLDLFSLPGIAERRVTALWRFHDRYAHRIGQQWRDVGEKRPDAP